MPCSCSIVNGTAVIVIGRHTNRWRRPGCHLPRRSNGSSASASRQTAGGDVIRTAARPRRVNCTASRCRQRLPSTFHRCGFFVDELANVLATVVSGCKNHLLLCRDVNCTSAIGQGLDERLSMTLMEFGLTQHVTQPTRGDRLLDTVVSDNAIPV